MSLLDVCITILPARFCRGSKVPLFTPPQHAQTPAQYSSIGVIIDIKMNANLIALYLKGREINVLSRQIYALNL